MRVSLLASVIAHVAILLGALVSWGSPRMYDWRPPSVEVDIVPSPDAPPAPELKGPVPEAAEQVPARQETPAGLPPLLSWLDTPQPQSKPELRSQTPPQPATQPQQPAAMPQVSQAVRDAPPVAPPKPLTAGGEQPERAQKTEQPQAKLALDAKSDPALEQAEAAARLAELINVSPDGKIATSAVPSSNELTPQEIADLKARISKCWAPMQAGEGAERTLIIIRVAFNPNGALAGEPQLIQAPAVPAGPLVLKNAMQAVQKCQPYGSLPRAKYKDWRVLDLAFTPHGIS